MESAVVDARPDMGESCNGFQRTNSTDTGLEKLFQLSMWMLYSGDSTQSQYQTTRIKYSTSMKIAPETPLLLPASILSILLYGLLHLCDR